MTATPYITPVSQSTGGTSALRWGGLPFMTAVFIQGLPIGRELSESTFMPDADKHAVLAEQVTTAGFEQTVTPLLMWGGLYFLAAGLVVVQRPSTTLKALRKQWPLSLLLLLILSSALWSPNTEKVASTFVHALGAVFIALAAALRYQSQPAIFVRQLAHVLSAVLFVHLVAVVLMPNVAINYDDRWVGLFPNPNTLGVAAFCSSWANAAAIISGKGAVRSLHTLALILCLIVLVGSESITSMVISAIGLLLTVLLFHIHFRSRYPLIVFLMLYLTSVLASVVLLLGLDSIIGAVTAALGRSADFTGRVFLWIQAIDLIYQSPWLGWGFDDHARVILETGMPHTTYHNGYLDLAVRGGVLGVGLFVAMLVVYLKSVFNSSGKEVLALSLPFLIAMLVFNVTEVSLAASRNLIWMIFLVLVFLSLPILRMNLPANNTSSRVKK